MIRVTFGTVLLTFSLTAVVNAQSYRWRSFETRKLIAFDFNCAETSSFPKVSLSKIVQRAIKAEDLGSPTAGDRAFAFRLQKHSAPVYFVPTVCGATGNCAWRLYRIKPVKYLGEIGGQSIYTYQSADGLPTIVTYGNISATEGGLSTYITKHGRYRPLKGEYHVDDQGLNGHPTPKFLERAKPQCKDYGS